MILTLIIIGWLVATSLCYLGIKAVVTEGGVAWTANDQVTSIVLSFVFWPIMLGIILVVLPFHLFATLLDKVCGPEAE